MIETDGDLIAYIRQYRRGSLTRKLLIVLNLGSQPQSFSLEDAGDAFAKGGRVQLATGIAREGERVEETVSLAGHEGLVIEPIGALS